MSRVVGSATSKVPILRWTPKHDRVVALHIAGMQNNEIAIEVGFNPPRVSQILADPRAHKIISIARQRFVNDAMASIGDKMGLLGIKAIDNIARTIEDTTFEAGTKAKRHQDAISFELLSRIGYGKKEPREEGSGLKLTKEGENRLIGAIEKANKAREIVIESKEGNGRQVDAGDVESGED